MLVSVRCKPRATMFTRVESARRLLSGFVACSRKCELVSLDNIHLVPGNLLSDRGWGIAMPLINGEQYSVKLQSVLHVPLTQALGHGKTIFPAGKRQPPANPLWIESRQNMRPHEEI